MTEDLVLEWELGPIRSNVGNGLKGPAFVDVIARLPEYPNLEIRARVVPIDGTYEVTKLCLEVESADNSIPSDVLRHLPLRSLVRMALSNALHNLNLDQRLIVPKGEDRGPEAMKHRQVALAYRIARLVGEAPTLAVADALKVSRATAARRVVDARKAKFLGADEIGQSGGAPSRLGGK